MNLLKAQRSFRHFKRSLLACVACIACGFVVQASSSSEAFDVLALGLVLTGFALYWASAGLLAVAGNHLGRFGLKYFIPPLIAPLLGLVLSYMRIRDHLAAAQVPSVSRSASPKG